MTTGTVARLAGIGLSVSSLSRAEAFYRDGLGFSRRGERTLDDLALFGLDGRAHSLVMALGAQRIELLEFQPGGRPYPPDVDSADIRFQHFAIVVRDMRAAHDRVSGQQGFSAISPDGPQRLPPAGGSVRAFKFRDPDGHPLELLEFPSGSGPAAWRNPPGDALCLGIDHSAIVIADIERSVDFYTKLLGLSVTTRSHNVGPAQDRLDDLPRDSVDVIALAPEAAPTPHVELLGYKVPTPAGSAAAPLNDIAATRFIFEVDALPPLIDRLRGAVNIVSPHQGGGWQAAMVRDPDGHAVTFVETPQA